MTKDISHRNQKIIFRTSKINPKTGERMYASRYGKKAWPILISEDEDDLNG